MWTNDNYKLLNWEGSGDINMHGTNFVWKTNMKTIFFYLFLLGV